jgi:hypothetical protein
MLGMATDTLPPDKNSPTLCLNIIPKRNILLTEDAKIGMRL